MWRPSYVVCFCALQIVCGVKVKVVMHSDQDDSRVDEDVIEQTHKRASTILPFMKKKPKHEEYEEESRREEKPSTDKVAGTLHPNEVLFPLIYKQAHVNSMFLFNSNWYTWATEKRTDGSKGINYYICYEDPKHCDDVGWERIDNIPKCALQIASLMPDDRACVNPFGVAPRNQRNCDGGVQMKVNDLTHSCGTRIRSLWRFVRSGHRPANAAKPADVNSLVCEDEEECVINIEYRIHHDRITFSLHEPTRAQTFKSALKRDIAAGGEKWTTSATDKSESRYRGGRKTKKNKEENQDRYKKFHVKARTKEVEGKGIAKEPNESDYGKRRTVKNKIKVRDDASSEDTSYNE